MSEDTTERKTKEKSRSDENVIYVGQKPPMNYVLAVITQFNSGSDEVIIKARGRAISTAVDAAEITRNRFFKDAELKEIKISTRNTKYLTVCFFNFIMFYLLLEPVFEN